MLDLVSRLSARQQQQQRARRRPSAGTPPPAGAPFRRLSEFADSVAPSPSDGEGEAGGGAAGGGGAWAESEWVYVGLAGAAADLNGPPFSDPAVVCLRAGRPACTRTGLPARGDVCRGVVCLWRVGQ